MIPAQVREVGPFRIRVIVAKDDPSLQITGSFEDLCDIKANCVRGCIGALTDTFRHLSKNDNLGLLYELSERCSDHLGVR